MIPRENRPLFKNKIAWVSYILQSTREHLNRLLLATTADIFQPSAAPLVNGTCACVAREASRQWTTPAGTFWVSQTF